MPILSIKKAAAELSVSPQWLKYWLVENPVDAAGVPFYVPMGRRWKFQQQDIERILAHMRALESARLGLSGKSKARLAGLLSQIGPEEQPPLTGHPGVSAKLLGELAVESVLGPIRRRTKPARRRVRLPRAKPKD
jgi:hypothetical protein